MARSQNPGVPSVPSLPRPSPQPSPPTNPVPAPVPPVAPPTPVAPVPGTPVPSTPVSRPESPTESSPDLAAIAPLDIEFLCNALDDSRAWCARRIPGFAKRQELVNCGKGWVEVCLKGCLYGEDSDACKSDASVPPTSTSSSGSEPEEELPAKTEPGQDSELEDNEDGLDNGDEIPGADLDEDLGRGPSECY